MPSWAIVPAERPGEPGQTGQTGPAEEPEPGEAERQIAKQEERAGETGPAEEPEPEPAAHRRPGGRARHAAPPARGSAARLGKRRFESHKRLAVADSLGVFGVVTVAAALIGSGDDPAESLVMAPLGVVALALGVTGRRLLARRTQLSAGRVLAGLAWSWGVLVASGTVVYLATATAGSPADALFESAAGFSTTALTGVDPTELSTSMQLFRASTQWIGGAISLLAVTVSLPLVMRSRVYVPTGQGRRADRLAPSLIVGRRRVLGLYAGLSAACGLCFAASGMGPLDSVVHAAGTVSTGGFSSRADSLTSVGAGAQSVAIVFMILGGASYFVLWRLLRGRVSLALRSTELWLYLGAVSAVAAAILVSADGIGTRHAVFTAASAVSTTGYAVTDWTLFPPAALSVLLIATATGAMAASAGGGLRIARAAALVSYARLVLRRHVDRGAVLLVRRGGRTIADEELERLTGYQIAHFGLFAIGAFLLSLSGVEIVSAAWTSVSVISTAGPSPATGPFGDATQLGSAARLLLIPGMLAGKLTILPLLAVVAAVLRARTLTAMRLKRAVRLRAAGSR